VDTVVVMGLALALALVTAMIPKSHNH